MVRLSPTVVAVIMLMSQIEKTTQIDPFCVTRSSNIMGSSPVIDFDAECFEPGEETSGFDLVTDTFSPPETGLYWLHFTAGLPNDYFTDVQLALPTRTVSIYRSDGGLVAVSSRSDIVELTAGIDRLQLSSAAALFSNVSDVQVSWSGFHLDSIMSNVAAFSVAVSPGTYGQGNIPFDVVFVDTHSGWNNDHYTIPVTGLWILSLHIGAHPEEDYTTTFLEMTPSEHPGIGVESSYPEGTDMNSVTFVAKINVGTEVVAEVNNGLAYSDITYQTSMSGFLYSPTAQPAVAWFVGLIITQIGPADPARFGEVWVNEGNGFVASTYRFIAPCGGLYYVAMTGYAYNDVPDMKMELLLNGIMKASVYSDDENRSLRVSRSRGIILRLSVGDALRVRIPAGYSVTSYGGLESPKLSVFTGFRISA